MKKEKETKKLKSEKLEKRVAPGTLYYTDPTDSGGEATKGTKASGKDAKS